MIQCNKAVITEAMSMIKCNIAVIGGTRIMTQCNNMYQNGNGICNEHDKVPQGCYMLYKCNGRNGDHDTMKQGF